MRERSIQKKFWINEQESEWIEQKMVQAKISNQGAFIRKLIFEGQIFVVDLSEIKKHTAAIGRIGNNINQITKRMNNNDFRPADAEVIKNCMTELYEMEKELLRAIRKAKSVRYTL